MMKQNIDAIVIRGEFFRNNDSSNSEEDKVIKPSYKNIMVQEYSGNMLFLQTNGETLLNIQKEGEPFDLTEYIKEYSTTKVSHFVVNYVILKDQIDVINPFKISKRWSGEEEGPLLINHNSVIIQNTDSDSVCKKINSLRGIQEKSFVYMEIYIYYKED